MKAWWWVIVGGMCETTWAICMKESDGFSNIFWTVITLAFLFTAVYLLNSGLKRGIPVGSGYAVWVGVGGIGSIIMGIIIFNEPLLLERMIFAAIILTGIVGVEMSSEIKKEEHQDG